jgi:hypothetical protein
MQAIMFLDRLNMQKRRRSCAVLDAGGRRTQSNFSSRFNQGDPL